MLEITYDHHNQLEELAGDILAVLNLPLESSKILTVVRRLKLIASRSNASSAPGDDVKAAALSYLTKYGRGGLGFSFTDMTDAFLAGAAWQKERSNGGLDHIETMDKAADVVLPSGAGGIRCEYHNGKPIFIGFGDAAAINEIRKAYASASLEVDRTLVTGPDADMKRVVLHRRYEAIERALGSIEKRLMEIQRKPHEQYKNVMAMLEAINKAVVEGNSANEAMHKNLFKTLDNHVEAQTGRHNRLVRDLYHMSTRQEEIDTDHRRIMGGNFGKLAKTIEAVQSQLVDIELIAARTEDRVTPCNVNCPAEEPTSNGRGQLWVDAEYSLSKQGAIPHPMPSDKGPSSAIYNDIVRATDESGQSPGFDPGEVIKLEDALSEKPGTLGGEYARAVREAYEGEAVRGAELSTRERLRALLIGFGYDPDVYLR